MEVEKGSFADIINQASVAADYAKRADLLADAILILITKYKLAIELLKPKDVTSLSLTEK